MVKVETQFRANTVREWLKGHWELLRVEKITSGLFWIKQVLHEFCNHD